MTRRPAASIVANPALVGAVTVLVVFVAVVLAYNANSGLPFVPTLDVKVQARNAAALGKGSEVREGGLRVGFVETVRAVTLPSGEAGAEADLRLDGSVGDLPTDTGFTIRPRSPLGLKYLEMVRGSTGGGVEDGHVFPANQTEIPIQFDDPNRIYNPRTRAAVRQGLRGFGDALAARGTDVNATIQELPRLFGLIAPVTGNLASPRTRIGRFFDELGDAARVVRPIAATQADLFTRTALTFEAISSDTEALKETISRSHPAFQAGIESLPVQRPFLEDSAELARATRPVARELRPTLPLINDALEKGVPVVRRSVPFYRDLRPTLVSLRDLANDPNTGIALRGLTATATSLKPQLRFLGPYQTVCNFWNYFWTYLGEHVSQNGPFGYSQRAAIKSTGQQSNNISSMGAADPANGEGYVESSRPRGAPVHLHGQPYESAINEQGEADCENGQRGYPRRLVKFSDDPRVEVVTDSVTPGDQGTTYTGRPRVPAGQTFTREVEGLGVPRP